MSLIPRAVVFDLDGTAVPSRIDGMPSRALCGAIAAQRDRLHLCAATGRSWTHAQKPIKALGLSDPCVISGGTQIIDPRSEELLWEQTLSAAAVAAVRAAAEAFRKRLAYVAGLTVTEPAPPTQAIPAQPISTIYLFDVTPAELPGILERLHRHAEVHAAQTRSWLTPEVIDLHITDARATKEQAVERLLALLHIPKRHAAGVGDGHNDQGLLKAVGQKVAMGNAVPALKQRADLVIEPIDDDGLAKYINHVGETHGSY